MCIIFRRKKQHLLKVERQTGLGRERALRFPRLCKASEDFVASRRNCAYAPHTTDH